MEKNAVEYCNLPNKNYGDKKGAISYSTRSTVPVISENYIRESLNKFFNEHGNDPAFLKLTSANKS